jgi:hypothetical protein
MNQHLLVLESGFVRQNSFPPLECKLLDQHLGDTSSFNVKAQYCTAVCITGEIGTDRELCS